MSLYYASSVPIINFFKDSPQDILKDAALKSKKQSMVSSINYSGSLFGFRWSSSDYDADDVVAKTIIRVEDFIKSIIKWGIVFSGVAIYSLGATTGGMVTGAIALSSFLIVKVVNNKLSAVKDEYAKIYSWGINHFRSIFGAIFTNVPVMNYKLINNLY
ncbi:MAG: hypothetical protein K1000chlam1_00286 [Candidatus Anoxychlamydiales bacterium]|nr:hypothetical protein [Candidatus Anoxychlamydiales bacterium]